MAKKKDDEPKRCFWWILNQEEVVVATCFTVTEGGALAAFERATGLDRESYRAEPMHFNNNCCLSPMQ